MSSFISYLLDRDCTPGNARGTQAVTRSTRGVVPLWGALSHGWQRWANWKLWHSMANATGQDIPRKVLHLVLWVIQKPPRGSDAWADLEGWPDKGGEWKCSRRITNLCRPRGSKSEVFTLPKDSWKGQLEIRLKRAWEVPHTGLWRSWYGLWTLSQG